MKFFRKKKAHKFCSIKKKLYLCIAIEKQHGSIAQLNRAFDYGSKGYRFESYWSHSKQETNKCSSLFLFIPYKKGNNISVTPSIYWGDNIAVYPLQ